LRPDTGGEKVMSHGSHEPAKVVARFADQRVVKGYTFNFDPNKPMFTLKTLGSRPDEDPTPIQLSDLKAVFFVRDFVGNPEYNDRKEFVDPARGRKLAVTFKDGEVMVGTSFGYDPARSGFFLFPADSASNNEKAFILRAAVADVRNA
jgi:Family of unknown function (DUF6982)